MLVVSSASADIPAPGAGVAVVSITVAHRRRLRQVWRGACWPCQDALEVDLLAAGLLERQRHAAGADTLRVSDDGVRCLAETQQRARGQLSRHEALVEQVARAMQRDGRLVWRRLALRAPVPRPEGGVQWRVAMPDVFSIRQTTVEAYLAPVVHEIKVSRADLLGDLRVESKRAAYLGVGGACWYVIAEGIAEPDEIPASCGVMVARGERLEVARAAPRRPVTMSLGVWMALAKATPEPGGLGDDDQGWLAEAFDVAAGELPVAPAGPCSPGTTTLAASLPGATARPAWADMGGLFASHDASHEPTEAGPGVGFASADAESPRLASREEPGAARR